MKNKTWYYYGSGMDAFGDEGKPIDSELIALGADEVLARVDAVAVCASDIKMINMGNDYPLFKNRDFQKEPAVLGHELSLTIMEVGEHLKNQWKVGTRIGVQPDVYMDHVRYCIGVNVHGGMQKYMVLSKSVFYSDQGITVFPVDDILSFASVAQLEPNACVEAAYRVFTRQSFEKDKCLFLYIDEQVNGEYRFDIDISHRECYVCGAIDKLNIPLTNYHEVSSIQEGISLCKDGFEDVLMIGNPKEEIIAEIIEGLANDAVFCWMMQTPEKGYISCDIAKIHYSKINFLGCATRKLSDAFDIKKQRYELRPHGSMLIMGGAGAMGRMHTLRALLDEHGPNNIVVTARGTSRLQVLIEDFKDIAIQNKKHLVGISTESEKWKTEIGQHAPQGFDDIVVSAPGIDPVEKAVPYLKKDGMLVLFSGTKYGSYAKLPIGMVASNQARINASSGSTVQDEKAVLHKIMNHQLNPDKNVVGIAGFHAIKDALLAVHKGLFAGKVILYPQLDNLPLTSMKEIQESKTALGNYVTLHGWDREAEKVLYQTYLKEDRVHE